MDTQEINTNAPEQKPTVFPKTLDDVTEKRIENAVAGLTTLFEKNQITDDQLADAIHLNETILGYIGGRSGATIFMAGLAIETNSLKSLQASRANKTKE